MTHTRTIRDYVQQSGDPSVAALCVRDQGFGRLLKAVMNLSQLAESDARREEAQLRVRHHAALIVGIVCRIWQGRTRIGPSVQLSFDVPGPKIRICRYLCTRASLHPPPKKNRRLIDAIAPKKQNKKPKYRAHGDGRLQRRRG